MTAIKYSGDDPCEVSSQCYKDIEQSLEQWYNSQENPFKNYFENARRVDQKYVAGKFNLEILDVGRGYIEVVLTGKTNREYIPYRQKFHKGMGIL